MRKLSITLLIQAIFATCLAMVPVLIISDTAFAGTLETLRFSRNKVASIYDSQGREPMDCYRTSGICGGTKTATHEQSLPAGGHFKLSANPDPNYRTMLYVCNAADSCSSYGNGNIYAYKPGEYLLLRKRNNFPTKDWLLIFSLGSADPYLVSNGSTISWSFDSAILGQGIYNASPTNVTASVTGTFRVGETLTGGESYTGVDVEITRQWKRSDYYRPIYNVGGTDIPGATGSTYTLTSADQGKYVRYVVKTRNMQGRGSEGLFGAGSDYTVVVAALSAALTPQLGTYTPTATGFTVAITNYNTSYTWAGTATNGGSVSFSGTNGNGLATITGVAPNTASVATITTTRTGYQNGTVTSASTTSLAAALTPIFNSPDSTFGGFTVNVNNYDANYTYGATSSAGTVVIGSASGSNLPLTIMGLTSNQSATVTVTTSRSGAMNGSGSVSGASSVSAITTSTGPVGRWVANSISRDGSSFIVANNHGSIYRSTDNGVNWQELTGIQNWSTVDQSNNGTKIVGAVTGGKIHISTNSGATWSEVATNQNWRSVACSADCSTIIAAVAGGKLWRSTNTGTTWSEVGETQSWRAVRASDDGTKMIALPFNGSVLRSTNSGATWTAEQSQRVSPQWTSAAMNGDGSKMYAGFFSGLVQVSTDFGNTWSQQIFTGDNTALAVARDSGTLIQCGSDGRINLSSAIGETIGLVGINPTPWSACSVSGDGNKIMASSTTGLIYISTNGGTNWSERSQQTGNAKRRALVSSENGNDVFSVAYGGPIEYSADSGSSWSVSNPAVRNWMGIAASNTMQKLYAVAYNGRINRTVDSGANWVEVEAQRRWVSVACSSDGSKVIAAAQGGRLYTSSDSGETWTARATKRKWVSVASSSDGSKLVAVVQGGFIYTSTDSGATWTERESSRNWSAVASSSSGTKLVATVTQGRIYISSNSGVSWQAKASTRNWLNVASSTSGDQLLAVVGTGRIFYSSNSGSTWSAAESARNWRALYISGNGTRAYAADFGKKLYRSSDSGVTWTAL